MKREIHKAGLITIGRSLAAVIEGVSAALPLVQRAGRHMLKGFNISAKHIPKELFHNP